MPGPQPMTIAPDAAARIRAAFDAGADRYDRTRRQLVPCFDDVYRTLIERLPFEAADAPRVLDLGAGTGLVSAFVLAALPKAHVTLVDVAGEMLARARERLAAARVDGRARFLERDFATTDAPGPFDAVVSGLAIHHLEGPAKRRLFRRIHGALASGGVFVNADQILGATPARDRANRDAWLAEARALGATEADLAAARERMKLDRTDTIADQLAWLRDAAFADVACWFERGMFAVFGGVRR